MSQVKQEVSGSLYWLYKVFRVGKASSDDCVGINPHTQWGDSQQCNNTFTVLYILIWIKVLYFVKEQSASGEYCKKCNESLKNVPITEL